MNINKFSKITIILRGYHYSQVRTVVKNLIGTKLQAVEITMNTPNALSIIEKINYEFGDFIQVGAGTIMTYQEAEAAIRKGVKFILSPIMLSQEIIDLCRKNDVLSVPAAFSPTEMKTLLDLKADIIKLFPASRLGSKYISDVQAPLGEFPIMAVGGINAENVQEYFDAGAKFVGIGTGIFKKEDILNENEEGLRESIQYFESKLK
ncbi:bifunctional 4-hydroxy-2-oxoglutarate aldolase/2-dehydro-3-deoxy-phosphogluconate aldolase [Clostridium sp. D2Q-14]|uniref:bifunctional 4-hydroxy-2-oxoglutarate aldolase/2-dehydro-3-deoxy-phosphogluconate aldolase n=1 Tax=Anaeromonas gelatinilytica TaxID=2683194 RepID=UPI00193B8EC4|nr:bifunctional 4-hydroxy-2-oxoglutarate aldolase/2-dehydro-3-deoxy-phosphogluconate aldolase [Anaeromonas gelatinilytica]MBS4535086.1 bifunctional 4-hydroxy-2-oxoglutarate aldolase/2-dehydro-3-deoxy-phosphogluconate aldolase [Anaeromonas gelatinilytica]